MRRGRQPDRDGGRDARDQRAGRRSRGRADRGGQRDDRGRRRWTTSSCARATSPSCATAGSGEFDFVIAHGVYAWVPEPVRDDLLRAIEAHLAADGLAYVSYNANPGGYMRRALREAGLWFAADARAGRRAGGAGARALPVPAREPRRHQRLVGRAAREPAGGRSRRAGVPARARRPQRALGAGLVRGLRRARRRHRPRLRRRVRPDDHAARAGAGGGRGRAGGDLRRRPDPPRAADRHPALRVLPPVRAVPRQPPAGRRPGPRRAARPALRRARRRAGRRHPKRPARVRASRCCARAPPTRCRSPSCARRTSSDPDELSEALHQAFLAELADAAPRAAARALGRRRRAAGREPARPLAGARVGVEVTSLAYTTVRMEEPAARLLLTLLDGTRDRAAIRAEFRERTGRAAVGRGPRREPRRARRASSSSSGWGRGLTD